MLVGNTKKSKPGKMKPNLFNWATSELSQDAFICWLLEWAKPLYNENKLNEIALMLLENITNKPLPVIESLKIKRQYKNIDILVIYNNDYAVLIEDKIHTKNHGNQLIRYADTLKKEFKTKNISLVYFKTGDQSNYKNVKSKGYFVYKRNDFLDLLKLGKQKGIDNNIFLDYLDYLSNIDNLINSYKNLPVTDWHWDSWKGFYIELQKRLGSGEWDYVPQKNGGFLGFWWFWNEKKYNNNGFKYYLQLEHNKFCFKVLAVEVKENYEIRKHYRNLLFEKAKKYDIKIKQNGRCVKGKTKTMTAAKLNDNYIYTNKNGVIDLEKTIKIIKNIQKMISEI